MAARLSPVMEVFGRPGARESSEVPLLVIYSSELEEKYLAYWYRSMRGVCICGTKKILYSFSSAALESYCHRESISCIIWMKLDTQVFLTISYPESISAQVSVTI